MIGNPKLSSYFAATHLFFAHGFNNHLLKFT